ncbi:MAG: Clp protease ClpP [Actinomycetia bacterium]|nr:Clp protease ClpP [Actinomycetes bacterium]
MANRGNHQGRRGTPDVGYQMANAASRGGVAVVDIYGEIGWWGIMAEDFVPELRALDADSYEFHLSSPGGDVFEGLAIYQAILDLPGHVEMRIDAIAGSIASVIAQAGDHIVMGGRAQFMIHDAICGCFGNAAELRGTADVLDLQSANIADVYAERTGTGTAKQWRAAMTAGLDGTWYTSAEAVEAGLADEVLKAGARGDDDDGGAQARSIWTESLTRKFVAATAARHGIGSGSGPPDPATGSTSTNPVRVTVATANPLEVAVTAAMLTDLTTPDPEVDPDLETTTWDDIDDLLTDLATAPNLAGALADALGPDPDIPATYDPDIIRAGIEHAANNAPSPTKSDTPTTDPEPSTEELMIRVAQAMKEALTS